MIPSPAESGQQMRPQTSLGCSSLTPWKVVFRYLPVPRYLTLILVPSLSFVPNILSKKARGSEIIGWVIESTIFGNFPSIPRSIVSNVKVGAKFRASQFRPKLERVTDVSHTRRSNRLSAFSLELPSMMAVQAESSTAAANKAKAAQDAAATAGYELPWYSLLL